MSTKVTGPVFYKEKTSNCFLPLPTDIGLEMEGLLISSRTGSGQGTQSWLHILHVWDGALGRLNTNGIKQHLTIPAQVYYSTLEYLAFLARVRPINTNLGLATTKYPQLKGILAKSFNNF